jgi:hypothetical protein
MKKERIYIKIWNADTDTEELRPFSVEDAVELLQPEEDPDTLAWAMGQTDQAALDKVFDDMWSESFTYVEVLNRFLKYTDKDLVIEP